MQFRSVKYIHVVVQQYFIILEGFIPPTLKKNANSVKSNTDFKGFHIWVFKNFMPINWNHHVQLNGGRWSLPWLQLWLCHSFFLSLVSLKWVRMCFTHVRHFCVFYWLAMWDDKTIVNVVFSWPPFQEYRLIPWCSFQWNTSQLHQEKIANIVKCLIS